MTEYNLFCYAEDVNKDGFQQLRYRVWNKEISEDRYFEVRSKVKDILKDLKLELNGNYWSEEWKKVTKEQWLELSKIPEFDKEITEKIIGFKLEEPKEMTVTEISEKLGYEIKIIKKQ